MGAPCHDEGDPPPTAPGPDGIKKTERMREVEEDGDGAIRQGEWEIDRWEDGV